MKNYYRILQIDVSAEKEIVEVAYRRLMRKYHPDVASQNGEDDADNEARVRDIIEAYEVLSDEGKRRDYDEALNDALRNAKQRESDDTNADLISKSMPVRCSVSGRTYTMHLAKHAHRKEPYIVRAFELVDEAAAISNGNGPLNLHHALDNARDLGKNMRAIIKRDGIEEEEIHIGDVDWSGVHCPDCGKTIQIKPGIYSSFSVCSKCHRLKCIGDSIRGVAGYYTVCPWCGKRTLLIGATKTGEKGGLKITGIVDDNKNHSLPRLSARKLLEKQKPPDTSSN